MQSGVNSCEISSSCVSCPVSLFLSSLRTFGPQNIQNHVFEICSEANPALVPRPALSADEERMEIDIN